MLNTNLPVVVNMKKALRNSAHKAQLFSQKTSVRIAFLGLFLVVISQKELSFQFSIGGNTAQNNIILDDLETTRSPHAQPASLTGAFTAEAKTANIKPQANKKWWDQIKEASSDIRNELNLANAATAVGEGLSEEQKKKAATYSNLGFALSPNYAKKHNVDPSIVQYKQQICLTYIKQYVSTAKEEAKLFEIPASITLAQGLLESNAGASSLARKDNNHFGIKCRKKCIGCRCANYTDDSKFDMFRIFESSWESFREHSKLLSGKRYKHLKKLKRTDYKNWANGLQAAGYATDKKYAKKLIGIIEAFQLYKYDQ
ncbi:MAG: mannosyl-glycoprotein endo-beta-N-acetylglucosamidase [Aureispira sp.]|nr:mannosyl-glycoprotein endo-beta-N-acetylglucosamidase [Aureispira sp.]